MLSCVHCMSINLGINLKLCHIILLKNGKQYAVAQKTAPNDSDGKERKHSDNVCADCSH